MPTSTRLQEPPDLYHLGYAYRLPIHPFSIEANKGIKYVNDNKVYETEDLTMAKEIVDLREELRYHKFEFDLLQKVPCTKQQNKELQQLLKDGSSLPEGVYAYVYNSGEMSTTEFYTVLESDLTESEIREYLTYKQLSLIKTIKNCVLFFTILTIVGMFIYFLFSNLLQVIER